MALSGFDAQVASMEAGLVSASGGFGRAITLIGEPDTLINVDFLEDERPTGLRREGREAMGQRVRAGINIELLKSDLPTPWDEQQFRLPGDNTVYTVGELDDSDVNLLSIVLVPALEAAGENSREWLRD